MIGQFGTTSVSEQEAAEERREQAIERAEERRGAAEERREN